MKSLKENILGAKGIQTWDYMYKQRSCHWNPRLISWVQGRQKCIFYNVANDQQPLAFLIMSATASLVLHHTCSSGKVVRLNYDQISICVACWVLNLMYQYKHAVIITQLFVVKQPFYPLLWWSQAVLYLGLG